METRDWKFFMRSYGDLLSYRVSLSPRNMRGDMLLSSDLTRNEAMALLSLIGKPIKSIGYGGDDGYYFVNVKNNVDLTF
jgi:hypothetical protein